MLLLIAETHDVCRAYPGVPQAAVDHLLHALHRAVPLIEAGRQDQAVTALRTDLAAYRGSLEDFERLGVRAIFRAAGHGRHPLANQLGDLRLLAATRDVTRYVIAGDTLEARLWARERGIDSSHVIAVRTAAHADRLAGLDPGRTVVVELENPREPRIRAGLDRLVTAGAAVRAPSWRPGHPATGPPAGGHDAHTGPPRLQLRAGA